MKAIDPTKYTAHLRPGKFEGETPETEYFYEQMLEGNGDTIWANLNNNEDEPYESDESISATVFEISADETEAFDIPEGRQWFLLRENSQGFVGGSTHATREEAEQKFYFWLGY